MPTPPCPGWRPVRRDFLRATTAALGGLAAARLAAATGTGTPTLRFGLITDPHYADTGPKGTRHYRESLPKVREAVARLRAEQAGFLAVLGDVKDMEVGEPEARTRSHLVAIERELRAFGGPTYYVLGNHDMDNLSKPQALAILRSTGIPEGRGHYAFSQGGVRFVALDATYDRHGADYDHGKFDWKDANVPAAQLAWLESELGSAREPVIILAHQRLDGDGGTTIRNAPAVRALLERSGRVLAAFQGHDHPGGHTLLNGIHYYTLRAVVEGSGEASNAYALAEVGPDLGITITGFRRAVSQRLERGRAR